VKDCPNTEKIGNMVRKRLGLRKTCIWNNLGQNWTALGYDNCAGTHQSPISIYSRTAIKNDSLELILENYDKPIKLAFIENNGHTGIAIQWFIEFFQKFNLIVLLTKKYIFYFSSSWF
jgi:hypothetical protein